MGYLVMYPGLDLLVVTVVDGIIDVCDLGDMSVLCSY